MENRAHVPLNVPNPTTQAAAPSAVALSVSLIPGGVQRYARKFLQGVFATLLVLILLAPPRSNRNSLRATPDGCGHLFCGRADDLARVQAMAVSAVYRDATRVCGLADFFAQVSRSTGDLGSDDLWGTPLVLRATPEYHARAVAEDSGLVAQVLSEACLDMAEGADRTRRWTTEVLKVLYSAKAAMAEHGHNVSMISHQAELEKAFVIAPQLFMNDRASLNAPYRRLIAFRLNFLLGSIDAAKKDLQSYRDSKHLRALEPHHTVQSSWFSSARKSKNTAAVTVADSDGPFDVVRTACVDANEVITGHWKTTGAGRYPQKKYHLSPSWSDVLTNPVALDEFIAILEWHQTVNDHDVQRFEASRANRTLISLVKA